MPGPANSLNITQPGFQSFDGVSAFHGRAITPGPGMFVTNGDGIAGPPIVGAIGGQPVVGLTPDTGSAVTPDASTGLIKFETVNPSGVVNPQLPSQGIAAHTFGACAINNAKWIVDPTAGVGTHQTIAAASTAASTGETVFIRPGTYTEDWSAKAGVNYVAYTSDGNAGHVILKGKITCNFVGTAYFAGVEFLSNGSSCFDFTGSSACNVQAKACNISVETTKFFITANNSSAGFIGYDCIGGSAGSICQLTAFGTLGFFNSNVAWTETATVAVGLIQVQWGAFLGPISTTSTGSVLAYYCTLQSSAAATITLSGTGTATLYSCTIASNNQAGISIGTGCSATMIGGSITTSATNVVTGAGTFIYSNVVFGGTGVAINPTTSTLLQALDTGQTGTFTPTLTGGAVAGATTYTSQVGYYTRIGNLVFCNFFLQGSAATGTGNAVIGGLPFTVKNQTAGNTTYPVLSFSAAAWAWVAGTTNLVGYANPNAITSVIWCQGTAGAGGALQMANAAFFFQGFITYQV